MTRINAQNPEEMKFRSNDTVAVRVQKLELMRQSVNQSAAMISTKNLLYTLAMNVQGIRPYLPETLPAITKGQIVSIDGEGSVFQFSSDDIVLATRDWLAIDPAGSYRSSFRAAMFKDGATDATLNIGFLVYTADGFYLGYHASTEAESAWTVADGFDTYEVTASGADIIAEYPNGAYVRSYIEFAGSNGGGISVYLPRIEDTTLVASALSAVALAQSAAADALAQAISAENSSTTAAGYASSAAASASDATGQASAAAASAVAAQSYRDESQTHANASATSASAAQTSATAAGASASAAETSRIAAEAANTTANSAASAASTSAAEASSSAAAAYQSFVLNAAISGNALNDDPGFDDYPSGTAGAAPTKWASNNVNTTSLQRVADPNGGYAFRLNGEAGVSNHIAQYRPTAYAQIKTDGYYVVEAEIVLVAGTLTGSGVIFRAYSDDIVTYINHYLNFSNDLDQTGAAPGAGTVGQVYQFRKLVKITVANAKIFRLYLSSHNSAFGSVAGTNTIEWRHVAVRPATNEEANVSVNASAIADINGAAAFYEVLVAASGGNNAAVRLLAGDGGSMIDLISNVVKIRNIVGGAIIDAIVVSGGDAIFNGGLNVGSYIRLGSGEGWPVALRSRDFPVSDGTVVTFDTNLGNLPMLDFSTLGLDALAAGESYNLYADNLTSTGFTARLKIFTVSSTTNYNLTTDTTPGTGPTRQIDKGANPDANSGNYTLKWSYSTHWTLYGVGEGAAAIVTFSIWVKKAGVWQFVQNYPVNLANQSTNATRAGNTTDTFQLGTGVQAFGVSLVSYSGDIDSATLTDFNSASWTTTTGASTRTATPSSQVGKVTVRPQ